MIGAAPLFCSIILNTEVQQEIIKDEDKSNGF